MDGLERGQGTPRLVVASLEARAAVGVLPWAHFQSIRRELLRQPGGAAVTTVAGYVVRVDRGDDGSVRLLGVRRLAAPDARAGKRAPA